MMFPTLLERTNQLPDPRQATKCTHILGEVVFMTITGLLCGADDWPGITHWPNVRKTGFPSTLSCREVFLHTTHSTEFTLCSIPQNSVTCSLDGSRICSSIHRCLALLQLMEKQSVALVINLAVLFIWLMPGPRKPESASASIRLTVNLMRSQQSLSFWTS
ncbi:transposase family protein [Sansalvadorimonas verongulae]|nr:transposase family protein [Sansalvadorimonas verongulae]